MRDILVIAALLLLGVGCLSTTPTKGADDESVSAVACSPSVLPSIVQKAVEKLAAEHVILNQEYKLVVTRGSNVWCVSFIHLPLTPDAEEVVFVFDDGTVRMMGEAPHGRGAVGPGRE